MFMKFSPNMCLWSHYGSHQRLDPHLGFLKGFFSTVRWDIFPQFNSYLSKNWSNINENFIIKGAYGSLDMEFSIKIWTSFGRDSGC